LDKLIPGPVERLVERKAIWQDPWNNEVYGGDQVANGLWAMASGGLSGTGCRQGFAKTIPEAHTDMILPSIGEEFGWAGYGCHIYIVFALPAPVYHYRAANRYAAVVLPQRGYWCL
jgi:cell division protein FtsW (lipid II flippase)